MDDLRPHVLAVEPRVERDEHVGAFLQQVAVLREPLLEQHRLVLPGGVGKLDDSHLLAALGAPLHAVEHVGGEPARRFAGAHAGAELGPADRAHALDDGLVRFQRMAREEEADGVEFALQPVALRPRRRPHAQRRLLRLAEQRDLALAALLGAALAQRQHRLDGGEGDGALGLQFVEGAGGGEAFERLLVDLLGVDAACEIRQRGEGAAPAARVGDGARLRVADAFHGAERVEDRRAGVSS